MIEAMFGLGGRTALVSGAAQGIGAAIAEALARAGANLVLWGRSAESLARTADDCRELGAEVELVTGDLSDPESTERTANDLAATTRIDILVNNAGTISRAPVLDVSYADWHWLLTVNLDSAFLLSRAFGRGMVERGYGSIINTASLLSFQGGINVASYATSKHALVGLTKALANEWAAHNVTVNAVAPGYVNTSNTAALRSDADREPAIRARIPLDRWAEASDIAGAVVFLAGPSARYVTGHTLVVDGGWLAR